MLELVGTIVTAWLGADLLAGFWHWLEDRYFDTRWPIIGKYIAKPNELHHEQPTAFLFGSYWRRNWTTIVPAGVALLIALAAGAPAVVCLALVFVSQANEVHAWAHAKGKVSPLIATIQATGVLQSPAHHAEHHRSPFDCRYCVMSDLLNPLLDRAEVWRRLEKLLSLAGVHPK